MTESVASGRRFHDPVPTDAVLTDATPFLTGASLVAALDIDPDRALVRLITADGDHVHLVVPEVTGELAAAAEASVGMGTVETVTEDAGHVVLDGPFGWIRFAAGCGVTVLDRWHGTIAPTEGTAQTAGERLVARIRAEARAATRIRRDAADGWTETLLCAAGDLAAALTTDDTGRSDGVVFVAEDLLMRTMEVAGLLGHPTTGKAPTEPAADGGPVVSVLVTSLDDDAVAGGIALWLETPPNGWIAELAGDDTVPDQVSARWRPVAELAAELTSYLLDPTTS